ncbi:MAG: cytochrome b [Wenzhouxiangella sp.]
MRIALTNTERSYGLVSQSFHWLVVALIGFQYVWAWRIGETEGLRARLELVTQHKTIGMAVLVLAASRLLWRLLNRPPPLPGHMQPWERLAAKAGHWLLYALIFAQPLSGWLYSSAAGYGEYWWGPIEIPSPVSSSEDLEALFAGTHEFLGVALLVVAGVHALAALRHHFLLRDDVLKRMLPIWRKE